MAAAVRPRDPDDVPTVADLRALCRGSLAPHKTPAAWYVAEALPMTGSGKTQKFRVQELIAEGAYPRLG